MTARPLFRPSELRKAVIEWTAAGLVVEITAEGGFRITPPNVQDESDEFTKVKMQR